MPRGDGTGPTGKGSRTGRGLGPCQTPGETFQDPDKKQGFFQRLKRGLGFGRNRGGRNMSRGRNQGQGGNR